MATNAGDAGASSNSCRGKIHLTHGYSDDHVLDIVNTIEDEEKGLSRSLEQRRIQMIACVGAIGTGLFLYLGTTLSTETLWVLYLDIPMHIHMMQDGETLHFAIIYILD